MSLDSRLKMCYSEGSGTCSLDLALDLVALATSTVERRCWILKYCKKISKPGLRIREQQQIECVGTEHNTKKPPPGPAETRKNIVGTTLQEL